MRIKEEIKIGTEDFELGEEFGGGELLFENFRLEVGIFAELKTGEGIIAKLMVGRDFEERSDFFFREGGILNKEFSELFREISNHRRKKRKAVY